MIKPGVRVDCCASGSPARSMFTRNSSTLALSRWDNPPSRFSITANNSLRLSARVKNCVFTSVFSDNWWRYLVKWTTAFLYSPSLGGNNHESFWKFSNGSASAKSGFSRDCDWDRLKSLRSTLAVSRAIINAPYSQFGMLSSMLTIPNKDTGGILSLLR